MKMVPRLYKAGRTTRQIAEILRLSLRDIGTALKVNGQKKSQETTKEPSNAIQAYRLFERGIPELEVAKKLNIREDELRQYKGEYWRLRGLEKLDELHKELGEGIWNLVSLHRRMREEDMKPDEFVVLLGKVQDLKSIDSQLFSRKYELRAMEAGVDRVRPELERLEKELNRAKSDLKQTNDQLDKAKRDNDRLTRESKRLEQFIKSLKTSEAYRRVEKLANDKAQTVLDNNRRLLTMALVAIIQAVRDNPLYKVLITGFDERGQHARPPGMEHLTDEQMREIAVKAYSSQITEVAERFYQKLLKETVDETMSSAENSHTMKKVAGGLNNTKWKTP